MPLKMHDSQPLRPLVIAGFRMMKIIFNCEVSLKKYPPIKAGTPDPYTPPE